MIVCSVLLFNLFISTCRASIDFGSISETMVLSVTVTLSSVGENLQIECKTGDETVRWLCRRAYEKYLEKYVSPTLPKQYVARRTSDRCLLFLDDRVKDVLNARETIEITPTHIEDCQGSSTVAT